jgi:hypothetical protein
MLGLVRNRDLGARSPIEIGSGEPEDCPNDTK